jgi:hypothetical protein
MDGCERNRAHNHPSKLPGQTTEQISEVRLTAWRFLFSGTSYAFCFYDLGPITDGGSAHAQVSSDLSLAHLAFLQQATALPQNVVRRCEIRNIVFLEVIVRPNRSLKERIT